ncbi:MAG TPA: SDR family oxidoreductase, partial [bacterium]|nr:SDR family oxidoreductase [bacterium]
EGARVAMCARGEAGLREAVAEVRRATGGEALAVPADLSRAEDVSRALEAAGRALGGIDILVANVGGPPPGGFDQVTDAQWLEAFEQVHLSTVRLIRGVLPHMRARRWGRILTIQSSSVKQPVDGLVLSNGIRPGVAGLFKTLAADLAPLGITVNLVLPGRIMTDRFLEHQTARARAAGRTLEEQMRIGAADIPAGRIGTPEEFAAVVVFLASERASYVTGTAVQVDGGLIKSNV